MSKTDNHNLADQAWEMVECGDLKTARDLFSKIQEIDENNAEAAMMLGTIDGELGQIDDAVSYLETAISIDPEYADAYLALAKIQFSQGDADLALKNALHSSKLDADYAAAWAFLGTLYSDSGTYEDAESASRRAIALDQNLVEGHVGLANALIARSDFEAAEKCYGAAIMLQPGNPSLHFMRGKLQLQLEEVVQAEISARAAIEINPSYGEAYLLLGFIQEYRGQGDAAATSYRKVLEYSPNNSEAHFCLGKLEQANDNITSALDCYKSTVRFAPENAEAHALLGMLQLQISESADASYSINRAIELQPDLPIALFHRGLIAYRNGYLEEAAKDFRRVIEADANNVDALLNLALVLQDAFKLDEAREIYEDILILMESGAPEVHLNNEQISSVHYNYAKILGSQGLPDESITSYRRAIEVKPDFAMAGSSILHALHNSPTANPEKIYEEHLHWSRTHVVADQVPAYSRTGSSGSDPGILRVGYVSPDFKKHSVAYFFEALLRNHDPSRCDIYCYSDTDAPDEITERFKGIAPHWCSTSELTTEELATRIAENEIDILVDLAGHTKDNRLSVFARRPAPVQVTYLGYPDTTGLASMDYRITDERTDPEGRGDDFSSEKLIRLSRPFLCYTPPENTPEITSSPLQKNGYITFGSLNSLAKINSSVVETWAKILQRVPDSHLLLKNFFLEDVGTQEQYFSRFEHHGISRERLELLGPTADVADHLGYYNRIDIALDTFPYNGTTTTCEALWMSVPVIAVQGSTHAGRVCTGILQELDLGELVAEDYDDYVHKACNLSGDKARLEELRRTIHDRFIQSRLCDGKSLADAIEDVYAKCWKSFLAK